MLVMTDLTRGRADLRFKWDDFKPEREDFRTEKAGIKSHIALR